MEAAFVIYELMWYAVFLFTLSHGWKRAGPVFFIPAILWGFLLEFSAQEIFSRYYYGSGFLFYLMNVPLCISLTWASLMYWGYFLAVEKLKLKSTLKIAIATALPLLLLDVLLFEPLAKIFGYWVWTPESVWFGSPIGNVVGWFFVIALYTLAYHLIVTNVREKWKQLAANLLVIIPNLIILMLILRAWIAIFGLL